MLALAEKKKCMVNTRYFGEAQVIESNKTTGRVRIHIDNGGVKFEVWAKVAILTPCELMAGSSVLAAGEDKHEMYVIGVLDRPHLKKGEENSLKMACGANATVSRVLNEETLFVQNKTGEIIFEYHPETGKSRINIESGDLEFSTKKGNIEFISAKDIRFSSKRSIEMKSLLGIKMMTTDCLGKMLSGITLQLRKMTLDSPSFGITAKRGEIHVEELTCTGKNFLGRIGDVKFVVGRIETAANDIIQKAKTVYKTVEGLTQLKTGRLRTLIDTTYHLKSNKTFFKAKVDFKVKGEKIHLG